MGSFVGVIGSSTSSSKAGVRNGVDEGRDLALLGLWTDEGGLIALDKDLNELGAAADGATLPAAWARLRNFACVRGEGITITRSEGICPGAPRSARLAEPQE